MRKYSTVSAPLRLFPDVLDVTTIRVTALELYMAMAWISPGMAETKQKTKINKDPFPTYFYNILIPRTLFVLTLNSHRLPESQLHVMEYNVYFALCMTVQLSDITFARRKPKCYMHFAAFQVIKSGTVFQSFESF